MAKFPVDAPKTKVIKALESLGFTTLREREHIVMVRENEDGTRTPLTMQITIASKVLPCDQSVPKQALQEKTF